MRRALDVEERVYRELEPWLAGWALTGVGWPHVLLHLDTRSDNLRLQAGGRLRLFDWPYACLGPPEFDVAAIAGDFAANAWREPIPGLPRAGAASSVAS